jgi:hypothetical protein
MFSLIKGLRSVNDLQKFLISILIFVLIGILGLYGALKSFFVNEVMWFSSLFAILISLVGLASVAIYVVIRKLKGN